MGRVDPTYPPLDVPKRFAEDVWVVDSGPLVAGGLPLPVRMTVIRLQDGTLLMHSPTRHTPALQAALEAIGPIAHLVLPNSVHWMFGRAWQSHAPGAETWAAPGLRERRAVRAKGPRIDHDLPAAAPHQWGRGFELVTVPGAFGFREVALFHAPSRTLVMTDMVQGLEPHKLPGPARLVVRALGGAGPDFRPPVYLRTVLRLGGRPTRAAARRLLDLRPAQVIVTHGRNITRDGDATLRRSLAWLVD